MGEVIAQALGRDLKDCAVYERFGHTGERDRGDSIDRDAVAGQLERSDVRERCNAGLRGAIRGVVGARALGGPCPCRRPVRRRPASGR